MRGVRFAMVVSCAVLGVACNRDPGQQQAAATASTIAHAASVASAATPPPGPPPPVEPLPPVAGEHVLPGTLRTDDSVESLRKRYGASNVKADDIPAGEEMEHGIVLYPDDPTRRAYLYFEDPGQLRGLTLVRVLDQDSHWQLPSGVRMGMPLSEIVRRNGKRIQFTGFGWDYGGTVSNWNNGRLQPLPGQGRFSLTGRRPLPERTYLPQGEKEVWSDDPTWPTMDANVIVGELVFGFPKDADRQSSKR